MSSELAMFIGIGGFGISSLSILVLLTISFPKLRQIEDLIAGPERSIMTIRAVWGEGPYGRLNRSCHIVLFLLLRHIPLRHFQRTAANIGNPDAKMPVSLHLWAIVPPTGMFIGFITACIANQFLNPA
ncbi:hypothetical protein [Tamilnaduibacter salinus]|uniref:hypothetical protein n=1 Tax=Tamilnaduibacter salinus TaxID=1484056 RepID=UPI001057727E|nr:hypothetical protein [Tamilnaduibacter salinus]